MLSKTWQQDKTTVIPMTCGTEYDKKTTILITPVMFLREWMKKDLAMIFEDSRIGTSLKFVWHIS